MYLTLERIDIMALFGKGNTMNMIHEEGLPGYTRGTAITMTLDESKSVSSSKQEYSKALK